MFATATRTDTIVSINPSTGEIVGSVPITPVGEIPGIVARACAAQPDWCGLGLEGRAKLLRPAGATLVARCEQLGRLLTLEMGKPLAEGIGEAKHSGASLDETIDEIIAALGPTRLDDDNTTSTIYRDPFGVCAVIAPWNFPISMPHWMMIPALMAGNTVVLKPSEETPLIAQAYVDILNETLPAGVVQIVHGADEQGRTLTEADVDLIAFTGSREVGKKILNAASGGLKRVILELGGKDPMIVLGDADVEGAATFAVRNSFRNAGQVCVSTERIYVDESIADDFEQAMARLAGEQKVGDGTEEGVTIGPMVSKRQCDHVLKQIDAAVQQGAKVIAGGSGHHHNFVVPTILTNVTHDMDIMKEETFGPVACVMRVRNDDEAIDLANDTPFGLGASVFGAPEHAANVARQLGAGMIGVNKSCGGASGSPWVGAQESGYGFHSGPEGHRQFAQARVVSVGK